MELNRYKKVIQKREKKESQAFDSHTEVSRPALRHYNYTITNHTVTLAHCAVHALAISPPSTPNGGYQEALQAFGINL